MADDDLAPLDVVQALVDEIEPPLGRGQQIMRDAGKPHNDRPQFVGTMGLDGSLLEGDADRTLGGARLVMLKRLADAERAADTATRERADAEAGHARAEKVLADARSAEQKTLETLRFWQRETAYRLGIAAHVLMSETGTPA